MSRTLAGYCCSLLEMHHSSEGGEKICAAHGQVPCLRSAKECITMHLLMAYGLAAAMYAATLIHTCPSEMQSFLALCCAQMRLQVGASWLQQAAATGQSAARRVLSGQSPFP